MHTGTRLEAVTITKLGDRTVVYLAGLISTAEVRQKCSNAQACLKSFLASKALYSVNKFLAKNGETAHLENKSCGSICNECQKLR